jgi:hypothetical protein
MPQLIGNYTRVNSVAVLPGIDEDGKDVLVTPKVWMNVRESNGKEHPATVTFGRGCGRVLFSSYHTEGQLGGGSPLIAQEKALMYILLEVTACAGQIGPPQ